MAQQRIMITAAASGIGRSIAKTFHENGAEVHICDVSEAALEKFREEFPEIGATHVDVTSEQAVELRDHVVIPVGVMVSAPDCTAGPTGAAAAARWDSSSAGYRRTSPR